MLLRFIKVVYCCEALVHSCLHRIIFYSGNTLQFIDPFSCRGYLDSFQTFLFVLFLCCRCCYWCWYECLWCGSVCLLEHMSPWKWDCWVGSYVFWNDCPDFHFHNWPASIPALGFLRLLNFCQSSSIKWCPITVLPYISLITNKGGKFFIFIGWMCFFYKMSGQSFCPPFFQVIFFIYL